MKLVNISIGLNELILVITSFFLCCLLIALRRHVPRLTGAVGNMSAVQSMHIRPTPRVGGLAIFGSLGICLVFLPVQLSSVYGKLFVATSFLFVLGLLEDLGFGISPRNRLLAAIASSIAMMFLFGTWLPRADVPGLNILLTHWSAGGFLTVLLTVGIANGFNMIDGVNGLASMTAFITALALSLIASQSGYIVIAQLAVMVAACILGFLFMNYPFGLIFLGDAGACTLGFVLSWFGILILVNVPEVTPWAILLTMFWPVADMLLAIYRRARRSSDTMAPDRLHVHQLVMRAIEICFLGRKNRSIANPLSTFVLFPFVAAPPIVGVIFWNQTILAILSVIIFGFLFFSSYAAAIIVIKHNRSRVVNDWQNLKVSDV